MRKVIVLLILFVSCLQAVEEGYTKEISLGKDQYQTILVSEEAVLRVLKFRWTLYAGDGLVMHLNFNDLASQFILYRHYKKDTFRVRLLPKLSAYKRPSFLYLTFKKFDHKTNKAYFDIVIDDPEKRALVEVKPLKEKQ